jgi:isopentenyl-diphosphate delta-isomerase
MEEVILVDENDRETGTEEKLKAHREGRLHRAFSVFVFNSRGEIMLQQRASQKYHSPGLWTNTCCSHPAPGEQTEEAAHRRLVEEMGFDCELKKQGQFIYKVKFDNGLYEHELDHVFAGHYEGEPLVNPMEVQSWKWIEPFQLKKEMEAHPEMYTYWLKMALEKIKFTPI